VPIEPTISSKSAEGVFDRFLLAVIHDLRAPLRQSILQAQMLERSLAGRMEDSTAAQLLSIVEGNRLANQFLGRLGEYCHAGPGSEGAPYAGVDVLLQNAIRTAGTGPGVEVVVGSVGDVPVPSRMQKVFEEFLDNARKFRRGPVCVQISSRITGSECLFEVRDNGIGFEAPYAETIWEPFQRLHGAGEYPGFGLGLAIIRRIISGMNGKTWATSAVGEGSSFCFSVPLP
jgi:signal transduction histidine kinase